MKKKKKRKKMKNGIAQWLLSPNGPKHKVIPDKKKKKKDWPKDYEQECWG